MSQSADVAAFLDGKETLDEPQPKKRGEATTTETEKKGDKDAPATRAPGAQSTRRRPAAQNPAGEGSAAS